MSEADEGRLGVDSWIVLLALVMVPAVFATGFSQFETVKEILFAILAGGGLAIWGGAVIAGRKISLTAGRITSVLVAFVAFALVSIAWASNWQPAAASALHWLSMGALFLLVVAPVGRPIRFRAFGLAVSVGLLTTAAFGLLDLAGVGLFTTVWDPPGAAGAFDAREFAIGTYAVGLPIVAAAVIREEGVARILAAVALLAASVHFGLTSSGIFLGIYAGVLGVVAVVVGVLQGFDRMALLVGVLGALTVSTGLAVGASLVGPEPGRATDATQLPWAKAGTPENEPTKAEIRDPRFAIRRIEEAPNWEARNYLVGIAFDLFRDQPVIGQGPDGWWANQTKHPRAEEPLVQGMIERYPAFRAPHNGFALVMVELGAIGLLLLALWLSAVIGITTAALGTKTEPEDWIIDHFALSAAATAGVGVAIFTPALQLASATVLLTVALGLLVRESAAVNEYKGLSEVWTINGDGRRLDVTLFCGVLPVLLGVAAIGFAAWWGYAEYYRSWGDLAMLRGKHQMADEKYEKADQIMGGSGEVLFNRALAKRRLGQFAKSVDVVNAAAKLRPYDARIVNTVAALHIRHREYADAAKAARRAVELFPNFIEARRNLAAALDLQGRMEDAANELVEVLELDPPDGVRGQVHRDLAEYYEGPLDNPKKALEHYEKALPLLPPQLVKIHIEPKLKVLRDRIERERLMREGKPIPPDLLPQKGGENAPESGGIPGLPDPHQPGLPDPQKQ